MRVYNIPLAHTGLALFEPCQWRIVPGRRSSYWSNYVLNEVLRLYHLVPANFHIAMKDTTLRVGGGPDQKSPVDIKRRARLSCTSVRDAPDARTPGARTPSSSGRNDGRRMPNEDGNIFHSTVGHGVVLVGSLIIS
ncbi:hypothetical protein VTN77DRAFT_5723 [Rasamsonia byssochlamydoides]|uniref:uncharacterized protein n=1 Tax=Rasamsonia byssochlamydoides TaxID=89139 RepID=UPI003743F2F1